MGVSPSLLLSSLVSSGSGCPGLSGEVVVGENPSSDSLETEPVAEEGEAEEDQERLDLQGLDC